jgi:hypothetical protein
MQIRKYYRTKKGDVSSLSRYAGSEIIGILMSEFGKYLLIVSSPVYSRGVKADSSLRNLYLIILKDEDQNRDTGNRKKY